MVSDRRVTQQSLFPHQRTIRGFGSRELTPGVWTVECTCGWAPQRQYTSVQAAQMAWNAHMTEEGVST